MALTAQATSVLCGAREARACEGARPAAPGHGAGWVPGSMRPAQHSFGHHSTLQAARDGWAPTHDVQEPVGARCGQERKDAQDLQISLG